MPDIRRERNRAGALRITNLDLLVPPSQLGTVRVISALADSMAAVPVWYSNRWGTPGAYSGRLVPHHG